MSCWKSPPNGLLARSGTKNAFLNGAVLLKLIEAEKALKINYGVLGIIIHYGPWVIEGTACSHHRVRPLATIAVGDIWSIHFTWNKSLKITTEWPPGQIGHQKRILHGAMLLKLIKKKLWNWILCFLVNTPLWSLEEEGTACSHHWVGFPNWRIAMGNTSFFFTWAECIFSLQVIVKVPQENDGLPALRGRETA